MMGRKKRKQSKPWCWYCNRDFEEEKILIQHQKARHFKCHICHKKLYTGPGLSIHCMQVHKEKMDKVPNSIPGRSNIEIEIYGMEGIPDADLKEHERIKFGRDAASPAESSSSPPGIELQNMPLGNLVPGIIPLMQNQLVGNPLVNIRPAGLDIGAMTQSVIPLLPGAQMMPPTIQLQQHPQQQLLQQQVALLQQQQQAAIASTASALQLQPHFALQSAEARQPTPLFPSAQQVEGSVSTSTAGNAFDRALSSPYSDKSGDEREQSNRVMQPAFGSGMRIIHPEEDLSLEELRSQKERYKLPPKIENDRHLAYGPELPAHNTAPMVSPHAVVVSSPLVPAPSPRQLIAMPGGQFVAAGPGGGAQMLQRVVVSPLQQQPQPQQIIVQQHPAMLQQQQAQQLLQQQQGMLPGAAAGPRLVLIRQPGLQPQLIQQPAQQIPQQMNMVAAQQLLQQQLQQQQQQQLHAQAQVQAQQAGIQLRPQQMIQPQLQQLQQLQAVRAVGIGGAGGLTAMPQLIQAQQPGLTALPPGLQMRPVLQQTLIRQQLPPGLVPIQQQQQPQLVLRPAGPGVQLIRPMLQ